MPDITFEYSPGTIKVSGLFSLGVLAVAVEIDNLNIFQQDLVYPGIASSGERQWREDLTEAYYGQAYCKNRQHPLNHPAPESEKKIMNKEWNRYEEGKPADDKY